MKKRIGDFVVVYFAFSSSPTTLKQRERWKSEIAIKQKWEFNLSKTNDRGIGEMCGVCSTQPHTNTNQSKTKDTQKGESEPLKKVREIEKLRFGARETKKRHTHIDTQQHTHNTEAFFFSTITTTTTTHTYPMAKGLFLVSSAERVYWGVFFFSSFRLNYIVWMDVCVYVRRKVIFLLLSLSLSAHFSRSSTATEHNTTRSMRWCGRPPHHLRCFVASSLAHLGREAANGRFFVLLE